MHDKLGLIPTIETYAQAENFIMEALPMFQKVGKKAIGNYGLESVNAFLRYLGNPHLDLRCIHVAGTNGKGSTAHMLAAVFQQNDYRTGLFTSPHLVSYRERMKVNGDFIPEEYVLHWVQQHIVYLTQHPLSFFEMSMGLACSWFQSEKVDICIIETGLGGRLDATNIITPELSIVTNIDFDHQDILGDSLQLIASEKAGIIKPGIPALLGNVDEELYPVFEAKASSVGAPLYFSNEIKIEEEEVIEEGMILQTTKGTFPSDRIILPTQAPYQKHNFLTVLHAVKLLKDQNNWNLSRLSTTVALENYATITRFRGRYEVVHRNPLVIADAAHNLSGIRFFKPLFQNKNVHLHLVIGFVQGKDLNPILSMLPDTATYYFCAAKVARAMEAHELQSMAGRYGLKGEVYTSSRQALKTLIDSADQDDIGLVIGSIYLLEEILQYGYL